MDGNYITRSEHKEFALRIDAENERQNRRIQLLEENVMQINDLTISVREMAVSMNNMMVEQKDQGERLKLLEKEPAETSRQIKIAIITSVVSTVVGVAIGAVLTLL